MCVWARRTCLECYSLRRNGSSGVACYAVLEFVQVDEGAAVVIVAVVGELASVEPHADGARLDAGCSVGGVGVDEYGLHRAMMRLA